MSGNCATGMRVSAIAPAIVITMAMTMASRGRLMKVAEIIPASPQPCGAAFGTLSAGPGATAWPGRTR